LLGTFAIGDVYERENDARDLVSRRSVRKHPCEVPTTRSAANLAVDGRLLIESTARVFHEICAMKPGGDIRHRLADVIVAQIEELAELRRKPGYTERAIEEQRCNARRLEQLPQYLRKLAELVGSPGTFRLGCSKGVGQQIASCAAPYAILLVRLLPRRFHLDQRSDSIEIRALTSAEWTSLRLGRIAGIALI
jgi:hypothetical protein